ncbi:hypothetical protein J0H58_33390 [bacterium]|nr:hypothetical protein [bacterium]
MTRLALLLAVLASGCEDDRERRRRTDELDALVTEWQYLEAHLVNLRRAADAELAGRPPTALPADAQLRLTALQQEYFRTDHRLRLVDAGIESVQHEQATTP